MYFKIYFNEKDLRREDVELRNFFSRNKGMNFNGIFEVIEEV